MKRRTLVDQFKRFKTHQVRSIQVKQTKKSHKKDQNDIELLKEKKQCLQITKNKIFNSKFYIQPGYQSIMRLA